MYAHSLFRIIEIFVTFFMWIQLQNVMSDAAAFSVTPKFSSSLPGLDMSSSTAATPGHSMMATKDSTMVCKHIRLQLSYGGQNILEMAIVKEVEKNKNLMENAI